VQRGNQHQGRKVCRWAPAAPHNLAKAEYGVTPDRVTMQRGARTGMVLRSIIRFEGFAEDGT
jgi:hypothetical protein